MRIENEGDTGSPAESLAKAVHSASTRDDVRRSVAKIYADLQAKIDERKPVCDASGRCCHFDEYGHRLYVTTLELAAFAGEKWTIKPSSTPRRNGAIPLPLFEPEDPGCRYQVDGLCSVHSIRPFGCRIFFCDPTAQDWQQDLYEITHERLKLEHIRLGVPYFYVEWRAALGEIENLLLDAIPPNPNNAAG